MSCQLRDEPARPFRSVSFWIVVAFIWLDLTMTFIGLQVWESGVEANPFYAPFTEAGVLWMFAGVVVYMFLVYLWFLKVPGWVRAISTGALVTIHLWGSLSWIRNVASGLDPFFDFWWLMVLPPVLGSVLTFLVLVRVRTCDGIPSASELVIYR